MSPTTRAIRDFLAIVFALLSLFALYSVAAVVMDDPMQSVPGQADADWRNREAN
jgi:hypothetical protein